MRPITIDQAVDKVKEMLGEATLDRDPLRVAELVARLMQAQALAIIAENQEMVMAMQYMDQEMRKQYVEDVKGEDK